MLVYQDKNHSPYKALKLTRSIMSMWFSESSLQMDAALESRLNLSIESCFVENRLKKKSPMGLVRSASVRCFLDHQRSNTLIYLIMLFNVARQQQFWVIHKTVKFPYLLWRCPFEGDAGILFSLLSIPGVPFPWKD